MTEPRTGPRGVRPIVQRYGDERVALVRADIARQVAALPEILEVALGYSVVRRAAVLAILKAADPLEPEEAP